MNFEPLYRLIRKYEGLRLKAYFCPAGVLTIGYGTTGPQVSVDSVWTKEQAEQAMRLDAAKCIAAVLKYSPKVSGSTLMALADFVYNLGENRYKNSTLRRKVESDDLEGAKREINKWVYAGHRKLPGLIARRAEEASMLIF
jgi:lysozyme